MTNKTIDLSVLKAALTEGGLLRQMWTTSELEGFGPAKPGTFIACFGPYIFIEDDEGMYLEREDKTDSNGFVCVAASA